MKPASEIIRQWADDVKTGKIILSSQPEKNPVLEKFAVIYGRKKGAPASDQVALVVGAVVRTTGVKPRAELIAEVLQSDNLETLIKSFRTMNSLD